MIKTLQNDISAWEQAVIRPEEIARYSGGSCFIQEPAIHQALERNQYPDSRIVRDILQKSLAVEALLPDETAALLNVSDPALLEEMRATALAIKKKVYDNRIVTFAPLYLSNHCVNNCLYCGFRKDNRAANRTILSMEEIRKETAVLAGTVGHKRLIVVYGEHPLSDIDYMTRSIAEIYNVSVKTRNNNFAAIRRVNVNAAPLCIDDLRRLHKAGIGTYQVFQETYHEPTFGRVHPRGTLKSHYLWRLYCMHRAFEAGIDDVGIGVLFGLYDWRFEVMALTAHARELESRFGIGPHTVSFPRLEPALNTPFAQRSPYRVSDDDFEKIITVIRLAIPYTGMIITARESAAMRSRSLALGITQTDASSKIGIGAYSQNEPATEESREQFVLGDKRSLDELIRELAEKGYITSFCTAGYRCGRTGEKIMGLLKCGKEGALCKLNAVLTFREWIDDFASEPTRQAAELIIAQEIEEVRQKYPSAYDTFIACYQRTKEGERDLYF